MMETILVHNKRMQLGSVYQDQFHPKGSNGALAGVSFRHSYVKVPITSKLIDYFQSHGLVLQPTVVAGKYFETWPIRIGFKLLDAQSSSQEGYVDMYNSCIFGEILYDPDQLHNHDVMLKLDIESMKEDTSKCILKPDVITHVFDVDLDEDLRTSPAWCLGGVSIKFMSSNVDDKLLRNWTKPTSKWCITVSLSLILTPKSELDPNSTDQGVTDHLAPLKRMRMDDTYSDFTIVARSGTEFKCDRSVLAAQSPYFDRMFKSGMTESVSRTLKLPHMSGEGVRAMLDYLYFWKTAVPEVNTLICVELLEAGHQYQVGPMEQCMRKLLLSKPDDWYEPDASLRLILFLKDMDLDDLKVKAIKVLKANIREVQNLPAYNELIKENPGILKQLVNFIAAY